VARITLGRLSFSVALTLAIVIHGTSDCAAFAADVAAGSAPQTKVATAGFGKMRDGRAVDIYTLTNRNGMVAKVITYGARLAELDVPDKSGKPGNIVLGYESVAPYEAGGNYYGAVVGRVMNRIAGAQFTLDDVNYKLTGNLHGGREGFARRLWTAQAKETSDSCAVVLSYISADGEEGYPGRLDCTVTYTLTDKNELQLDYGATTDKPTLVNLGNHSYFNLAGTTTTGTPVAGDVRKHLLSINADTYTVFANLIPTGVIAAVDSLPGLDFRQPKEIGQDMDKIRGYDHNFVINRPAGQAVNTLALAAKVVEPTSGRVMEVLTTEPGVQLYTAPRNVALCLETQHFPDSIHHPEFPSVVLRPSEKFTSQTVYRFSVHE
jgi:aldose 1-epimerase